MNGIFTLTWSNIRSALVYGLFVLGASFGLAFIQGILNEGSIFGLDWKHIVDTAIIATLPVLIASLSILKNLLTDNSGHFLGLTKVIPDNDPDDKE